MKPNVQPPVCPHPSTNARGPAQRSATPTNLNVHTAPHFCALRGPIAVLTPARQTQLFRPTYRTHGRTLLHIAALLYCCMSAFCCAAALLHRCIAAVLHVCALPR
jgi:hypothetical protein